MFQSLYQINTRVTLRRLATSLGRPATLDDIPDSELDKWAAPGFHWIWLLGVWQTGAAGRQVSLNNPEWRQEFRALLPDFEEKDVSGSCFAITGYTVHTELGGNPALARLRHRLRQKNLRLMLDFVPNHTAIDHPWVTRHPEFYVHGTEQDLLTSPRNYSRFNVAGTPTILAYGRDPYFPGWPDALQLNYGEPALQQAMMQTMISISEMCDGMRCDMAMLLLPDVFARTWGIQMEPFWPKAIQGVRARYPGFVFLAEVYWDLEWTLQQQGFTYTYDKRLYDRLRDRAARPVREHLLADAAFQQGSARFLENHDEPRAAAVFPEPVHRAAAVVTFLIQGLRFFHQGQFEGWLHHIPVHLSRGPEEPVDAAIKDFYQRLLQCVALDAVRAGEWQLLQCTPAWDGNWTWDCFISFSWRLNQAQKLLVVVNYAANQSQCRLQLPFPEIAGKNVLLKDLLSPANYERSGDDLLARGLYLDLPAWGYHVFAIS